jgi:two-component system OmpR family sensor kinase
MKRRLLLPLLATLPALTGAAVWIAIRLGWLSDHVVYLRARSLGTLLLAMGFLLTVLCGAGSVAYVMLGRQSRRRVREAQAREAAKHHQFLRRLDHELKNPLTAIQIEVANLETENDPQAEVSVVSPPSTVGREQVVQRLKDQVMRMNNLASQLRKLGELESQPIEHEPIHLDELLVDLVNEFQVRETARQHEIILGLPQIPWPLPEIEGDADLVYLALHNVLGNAVKFSPPGTAIQVRTFEDAAHVIVEIADQGPGIPEDELPHVLEELYRGKLARGLPGSGLGLAMVRAIVERHGGQIALRSRFGQGTVVTIRWPAHM